MTQPAPPREIDLQFGDGSYTFALPVVQLAELQRARGWAVTYPDGSTGIRPKTFGTIWREHTLGDYDPLDSREIFRLGLIGGGAGFVAGEEVKVGSLRALELTQRYFDPLPTEEQWKFATSILVAVCQGFEPPPEERTGESGEDDAGGSSSGNVDGARPDISTSPAASETAAPAD